MAKIYIPSVNEQFVRSIKDKGLGVPTAPHWIVARIALARSLQMAAFPDEELKRPLTKERGFEIHMEQLTGENSNNPEQQDYTDAFRLLLGAYHNVNLFEDRERFIELLQRHILRGMEELKKSWRDTNDFHDLLYQDLFFEWASDGVEPDDLIEKLQSALGEIGVNATIAETKNGPRLTRYILKLASGGDLDRLKKDVEKIQFILGISHPTSLVQVSGPRMIGLDIPRPQRDWQPVTATSVVESVSNSDFALPVCPGVDVLGEPYVFDLAEAPHIFVGGTTGSGKSVCIHGIMLSLLASGRDIEFVLIDPKEVEFPIYESCKKLWPGSVVTEVSDAAGVLEELVHEMDQRQHKLADIGVKNLAEAQAKGHKIPRIVVVIDELADLIMQDPDIEDSLVRLSQKARAVGIHLVLATQRPDAKTFSGKLRTNLPSRIGLSVRTGAESKIILEELGAEKLLGRGDMILRLGTGEGKRLHGAWIEQGDIRALL